MISLTVPSSSWYDAWLACVEDFAGTARDGSGDWQVDDFATDRPTFDALLRLAATEGDTATPLPPGRVHCDYRWITRGSEMLGFVAVRHSLGNELLRTVGGHIGYSIRPSARRRGHATAALGSAVRHAGGLGLPRVLVTCDRDNLGSARTIERNGGALECELRGKLRYWISCR